MEYQKPIKRILTNDHVKIFNESSTYDDLINFITTLNDSIVGVKLSDQIIESNETKSIMNILDIVKKLAIETPPVDNNKSRFGNPSFRTFYDKVQDTSYDLHKSLHIPEESIVELSGYFNESWGNKQRIDYGSGMELNFICWLICLSKLKYFNENDNKAIVLKIFWKYIDVMRYLQSTYWLEPAGSHGVWGLDDYHFLPFLWGAAQLKDHKYLRPKSIHDEEIMYELSEDYMYLSCINFINSIKTASLRWHSPMLDDISAVKSWSKVNEGMIKMYKAEVLSKLPIVQHFLFGTLLPCPTEIPFIDENDQVDECGHNHNHKSFEEYGKVDRSQQHFGDCCGIPVPSAFGQAAAQGKLKGIKRIPFD